MKKTFALLLAAALLLAFLPVLGVSAEGSVGLVYESFVDGTCYVASVGTCTDTDIVIPSKSPEGKTVTEIGPFSFYGCADLKSVTLPNSITGITDSAFCDCTGLTSVVLPDNTLVLGCQAFENCISLTSIFIPNKVNHIDSGAFYDCFSLTDVYFDGTKDEWDAIDIYNGNGALLNATIHFGVLPGDIDGSGEVTADDLTALARHIGKIETLTNAGALTAADYNGDNEVSSDDLTALARKVARIA